MQGVPIPAIVKHFRKALSECDELLDELAVPLTSLSVWDVQAGRIGPTVASGKLTTLIPWCFGNPVGT